jgi:hypothetical protein
MLIAKDWEREIGELLFNKEFQFGRMKNVLEMDGGCGCITI